MAAATQERHGHARALQSALPGDLITFGRYPQTSEGTDRTPIQWRVLENSGTDLLVLSERILDCRRYHRDFVDTTWRDCDLRKWLNEEFFTAAFDAAEKKLIKLRACMGNGHGSPDTRDKVFLLSMDEVRRLMPKPGAGRLDPKRRAVGTEYAKLRRADGCRLYAYHGSVSDGYITENGQRLGVSWWWLRDQPSSPARAAFVGIQGSLRGYCRVNRISYGVRPAVLLRLR